MCDGQHQLLASHQQAFCTAFGFFQFLTVMVAAQDIPFDEEQEDNHQDDGHDGDNGNGVYGLGTYVLFQLQPLFDECLFFLFEGLQNLVHA